MTSGIQDLRAESRAYFGRKFGVWFASNALGDIAHELGLGDID